MGLQAWGFPKLPVQQYLGELNAKQALSQATTLLSSWDRTWSPTGHIMEVANTPSVAAFAWAFDGCDWNAQVVAINKAYIIEVLLVSKGYFCKSGSWGAT